MKIAMISFSSKAVPSPKDRIFAPGVLVNDLCEELIKRGHKVDLFAPADSVTKANLISFDIKSAYEKYKELIVSDPVTYNYIVDQHDLYMYAKAIEKINHEGDYDIIHAHEFRKFMYFSSFTDVPIVYSYHGNPFDDAVLDIDKARLNKYFNNNFIIAATKRQIELGKKYLNFIGVVNHGVHLDWFPFNNAPKKDLLFVGRMMKRKGPDIAIKLADNLNLPITFVGDKIQSKKESEFFNKEVEPYFTNPKNKFVSHVKYDQMGKIYGDYKVLLAPISMDEPFGMIMIEAMACGTPVIAFKMGSVPELILDGKTGYIIKPGDLNAMQKAIKNIYSMNDVEYLNLRKNCREHVEKHFSSKIMANGYEEKYAEILSKKY